MSNQRGDTSAASRPPFSRERCSPWHPGPAAQAGGTGAGTGGGRQDPQAMAGKAARP